MDLANRIQSLRKERGWSQEQLGEQVGVSRQAVSKWESGSAVPDVENCLALSRAFGVTIGVLLEEAEKLSTSKPPMVEKCEKPWKRWLPWALCGVLALGCLGLGWWGWETHRANQRLAVGMAANIPLWVWTGIDQSWTPVGVDLEAGTATVKLSVTPSVYAGGKASFLLSEEGTEQMEIIRADWDGQRWTAEATLPLDRMIQVDYCVDGGGARQRYSLTMIRMWEEDLVVTPELFLNGRYNATTGGYALERGQLSLTMPDWDTLCPEITDVRVEAWAGETLLAAPEVSEGEYDPSDRSWDYSWYFGGLQFPAEDGSPVRVTVSWKENGTERSMEEWKN